MAFLKPKAKFSRELVVSLKEYRIPHDRIVGETVLLQYYVLAQGPGDAYAKQIGYTPVEPHTAFAPLCYFPIELMPDVQKQIDEIKERMRAESERKTAVENVQARTTDD